MIMSEFKKCRKVDELEYRPVTPEEQRLGASRLRSKGVFISNNDIAKFSPKKGDFIVRDPEDYTYQWLVAEELFNATFEPVHDSEQRCDHCGNILCEKEVFFDTCLECGNILSE